MIDWKAATEKIQGYVDTYLNQDQLNARQIRALRTDLQTLARNIALANATFVPEEGGGVKIFGREPTLWLAVIGQGILLLGTFSLHWLSGQQAALIVVALNALFAAANAYAVRPISPAVFTYAVGSVVSVAAAYGLNIPIDTVAAINALVITVLALMTRGQVSPVETPVNAA